MGEKLSNRVSVFQRSVDKSQEWVAELHDRLEWVSADAVFHLLRAVLQTLRDQLSVEEAAQLSAQLPMLLRGAFYECWDPQSIYPKGLGKDEFLAAVMGKMEPMNVVNFDFEKAVLEAFLVIKKRISAGEMDDVISALKPTMRSFIMKGEIEFELKSP
jgi:uncharacterized protein (DUF2267 family)